MDDNFRFASYFQENMVLQMQPYSAVLWGYGTVGSTVNVSMVQDIYFTKVIEGPDKKGFWKVILKQQSAGGPYTFQVVQDNQGVLSWILLKNVLFGDVWICGGQSNMQFTVSMVIMYFCFVRSYLNILIVYFGIFQGCQCNNGIK